MAFTGPALCNSWKKEIFQGDHLHKPSSGSTFKLALYDNTATLTKNTTVYTTSGELAATGGYSTGGFAVTNIAPVLSGDTGYIDIVDLVIGGATFTTYGALLYNTSSGNKAVFVLDFGGAKVVTGGGTFTVVWPAPAAATAIITLT